VDCSFSGGGGGGAAGGVVRRPLPIWNSVPVYFSGDITACDAGNRILCSGQCLEGVASGYWPPPAKRSSGYQPLGFESRPLMSLDHG
jgi:hypothetical protein